MKRSKWINATLAVGLVSVGILSGCGSNATNNTDGSQTSNNQKTEDSTQNNAQPVKLKLAMWESKTDIDFWTEKVKEYSTVKPNVSVEVETVPDNSGQYLKVRLAAKDLPDVFMMKPAHLPVYKDSLLPLDDLDATARNKYPGKIEDHVLGLPLVSFSEYVYYRPSIFKEVGVEVPQTLDEFVTVMQKIKDNGKYIPLSIGGKDDWTFYPISEFGPHILSNDEQYLTNLANTPEPFGAGSTFDKVANLVSTIAKEKLAGPDALGIGFDQSTQLFQSNKAAMIALGQWYYADHMAKVPNDTDLDAFPLPWRATKDEPLTSLMMSDQFYGISKNTQNPEEATAFLEWMFSKDVYQEYIDKKQNTSTMTDVTADLPFFVKVDADHPFEPLMYYATDEKFAKVKAAAQYDEKKVAAEIFAGANIADVEAKLNASWKKAVEATK
ncbi:ABC transporter substrate-binding protein [Paenibacillus sp. strain BS8-2]